MTINYTRPKLNGHPILYKGRRFWAFEVSDQFPYNREEEFSDVVVYDCLNEVVMISGKRGKDGSLTGYVPVGQDGIEVTGKDVKDFVDNAWATWKWCEKRY